MAVGRDAQVRRGRRAREPAWATLPDEKLLEYRLCDLADDLRIEGSRLEERLDQLARDLDRCGIAMRPHFWLSDDWFTPDGVPGIAIPFYMAHPRLARLEEAQMFEVEGGSPEWCMRILRHETGHAIDNAYRLRRFRRRQQIFGRSSLPYPESYSPRPYSREFVLHLESWYAQSHPDEDFAETFAVWLTPRSSWRREYAGWPALKKLEYVDELMFEKVAGRRPLVTTRREVEPLSRLRKTLGAHYAEKRKRYAVDYPDFRDGDLRRLFSDAPEYRDRPSAAGFLRRVRREVRQRVARCTGAYQYAIDDVLEDIVVRCRALRLRLTAPEEQTKIDFAILLAVHTMSALQNRYPRVAL
ncbi:MAG TPA: putative zinc-binding metallopeptidase [Candidatus Binatia bacterium]|nr:putative zinc-binding metallopeptidase [Candidatus Binatia bacterium]